MSGKDAKTRPEYIVCPLCGGQGAGKYGLDCADCGGMGLGRSFGGRFFYWGPRLNRAMIELDRLRKKVDLAINLAAFLVGVLGLVALGWWIYGMRLAMPVSDYLYFWREKSVYIMIFWIGLIADMFLVYRLSEDERKKRRIRYFKYDEDGGPALNSWQALHEAKQKYKIDVADGFGPEAFSVVEQAFLLAHKLNHQFVVPLHVFFCALMDSRVEAMFSRLNIDLSALADKLKARMGGEEKSDGQTVLAEDTRGLLIEAYLEAYKLGQKNVTPRNFIIACLAKDKILEEILYDMEIDRDKIYNVILWFMINERLIDDYRTYRRKARFKPASGMDRAYTAIAAPTLGFFGHDLTAAAKWGRLEYCVARSEDIARIWRQFESGRRGVILTGQAGVGKRTIVNGVAQLMVKEDVPSFIEDKRLVEIDIARLVSGASPAQAEERLLAIIDEVLRSGNIVLFLDNIENLMGITSGTEESLDLSEVLVNALERGNFYCLATATSENYVKYIESTPLGNALATVAIDEPAGNQAIQIVESKIGYLEGKYRVYFSYNAIEEVIELSQKYINDKYLPQKAVEIIELVAARVSKSKRRDAIVGKEDIAAVISEITGIPVTKITETEGQNLLNLEKSIHERMINQEEAVNMVAASLRRSRTDLRGGERPIASFLFMGPTGVGKTELAKTVADIYFGHEKYMVRLDMSEYQHPDSIKKMIGDAEGAKGYLTEAVRKKPFSLVLLDEFEKAHPDILNLFLQVMDDGRLTDGQGRTINFSHCIVIATSNVGAVYIQKEIFAGTDTQKIKQTLIDEHLNKVLRPELINRFDGIIVFEPLKMEHVKAIAKLMLKGIGKMLKEKGVGLRIDDEGLAVLAREGYDPKFGARPLRRLLQEKVEDKIANNILAGELKRRDTVVIDDHADVVVEKGRKI